MDCMSHTGGGGGGPWTCPWIVVQGMPLVGCHRMDMDAVDGTGQDGTGRPYGRGRRGRGGGPRETNAPVLLTTLVTAASFSRSQQKKRRVPPSLPNPRRRRQTDGGRRVADGGATPSGKVTDGGWRGNGAVYSETCPCHEEHGQVAPGQWHRARPREEPGTVSVFRWTGALFATHTQGIASRGGGVNPLPPPTLRP